MERNVERERLVAYLASTINVCWVLLKKLFKRAIDELITNLFLDQKDFRLITGLDMSSQIISNFFTEKRVYSFSYGQGQTTIYLYA